MTTRKTRKQNHVNQKGIALITALGLISTMAVLAVGLMGSGLVEIQAAQRFEDKMVAFHWAEGAMDQTIATLRTNRSYTGLNTTSTSNGRVTGNYQTTVVQSVNNPNVFQISAVGAVNALGSGISQQRNITSVVELSSNSPFTYGIFTNSTIAMSGNAQTDSYNSSDGAYNPGFATANGDVGTNRAGGNSITLSGNVQIKGDAVVGPNANVDTAIVTSGNAVIQGTQSAAAELTTLDPVTLPSDTSSSGALSISGNNTVTLPSGTYVYSSISVSGNGRLNLAGATTIYVTGNVSVSGNGIGTSQNLPPNLEIYVQGNRTVSLSGNANFYGAIYAPQSTINITGNGALFGAVVGNTLADSGNGKIHFDEALSESGSTSTTNQIRSWSEL